MMLLGWASSAIRKQFYNIEEQILSNICPSLPKFDQNKILIWKVEASWKRGQPRSQQTRNPPPDRESSITHDEEMAGWKSLVSPHRIVEPG